MDHSTPFQLVPKPSSQKSGHFVRFMPLPENCHEQLSDWMDHALEELVNDHSDFVSPNSSRRDFANQR